MSGLHQPYCSTPIENLKSARSGLNWHYTLSQRGLLPLKLPTDKIPRCLFPRWSTTLFLYICSLGDQPQLIVWLSCVTTSMFTDCSEIIKNWCAVSESNWCYSYLEGKCHTIRRTTHEKGERWSSLLWSIKARLSYPVYVGKSRATYCLLFKRHSFVY